MGRNSISHVRKPEILEHVYAVLKVEGILNTSLAKIANHMGVNSSLLIHYFKTKDNMMAELVDSLAERYANYFEGNRKALMDVQDPTIRLDTLLDLLFDPDWESVVDASVFWGCFYLGYRNEKIKERFKKMYEGFMKAIAKEIRERRKRENLDIVDSGKAAIAIIALIDGYAFYNSAVDREHPNPEELKYLKGVAKKILGI